MANYIYPAIALTGGTAGALDYIDGTELLDKDSAVVFIQGTGVYFYVMDEDSALAESSPYIISPDANAGNKRWILQNIVANDLIFSPSIMLTCASDAVTRTQMIHTIEGESAANDDLATINGGADGMLLLIRAYHTDHTITVKHGTGNILCGGSDVALDDTNKYLLFVYDAVLSKWVVIGGTAATPGADTQIVFNDNGSLGADSGLTYNKGTGTLAVITSQADHIQEKTSGHGIVADHKLFADNILRAKGKAAITSFAGTASKSGTTLTFTSAADAILAGYDATNPILGTTVVLSAVTMHILSWTNSTVCTVDVSGTITAATPTSVQAPISFEVDNNGVLKSGLFGNDVLYNSGNVGIGTTAPSQKLEVNGGVKLTNCYANNYMSPSGDILMTSSGTLLSLATGYVANVSFGSAGSILTLPDAGKITWDIVPASDHTCTGNIANMTAGEALTYGQCCYLKSDGKWYKADSDSSSTMPAMAIVADAAGISAAANGNFLIGWTQVIRDDSWDWVIGAPIYVSGTAGGYTQAVPATNFSQVQIVGFALTADVIALYPCPILVEVGLDIEAKDTGYAITWAELTNQVKTFTTDAATDQAYSFSSVPTSADVGKQFRISNVNATPGKLTLTLPTGVTCDNLGTAGGTVFWTGGNVTFELMTATVLQIVGANATVAYT